LNVGLAGPAYQSSQSAVLVKSPDVGLLEWDVFIRKP
jgi:hypothetical protein